MLPLPLVGPQQLRAAVASLPSGERFHLWTRYRTVPWERVLSSFQSDGSLLDLGCGPGLFGFLLAEAGFSGLYWGVDPDERKIRRARRWPGENERRRFCVGSAEEAPRGPFTQLALLDVLYLIPRRARGAFIERAVQHLSPGGRCVVLTSGGGPVWKRALDACQEALSVFLLRRTRGNSVSPCSGRDVADALGAAGMAEIEVRDIGHGYAHGFELVCARRPASSGS